MTYPQVRVPDLLLEQTASIGTGISEAIEASGVFDPLRDSIVRMNQQWAEQYRDLFDRIARASSLQVNTAALGAASSIAKAYTPQLNTAALGASVAAGSILKAQTAQLNAALAEMFNSEAMRMATMAKASYFESMRPSLAALRTFKAPTFDFESVGLSVRRLLDDLDLDGLVSGFDLDDVTAFDDNLEVGASAMPVGVSDRVAEWWAGLAKLERNFALAAMLVAWASVYACVLGHNPSTDVLITLNQVIIGLFVVKVSQ